MTGLEQLLQGATRELQLRWAAEEQRELELTEAEKYARDPLAWLDSGHVWIATKFDREGRELPKLRRLRMRLFPDQVRTVEAWIDLGRLAKTGELVFRNVVIEKSRQIGETWLFAAVICWALHYHDVTGLAMHTKGGKIDDGGERSTVESLFGRVRYIDRHLDRSIVPGLAAKLVFRPFSRDPAKIENPSRGSFCLGEGQTDNPGRGSTFDFALGDEYAFVEHAGRVYAALDDACPNGKALLSTVNGDATEHARLAKERPAGWTYLRLHWSTHPVYSQGLHVAGEDEDCALCAGNRAGVDWNPSDPKVHRYPGRPTSSWYDARVIGKTEEQVANELDIDRERAKEGRVYPEFRSEKHVVAEGIAYEPSLHHLLELALDPGLDAASLLVFQDLPTELRLIGVLEMGHLFGTSGVAANVAAALVDYLRELGVEERLLEFEWTRRIYGVCDPAGHNPETSTGKSYVQEMRRGGFYFTRPPARLMKTIAPSISAAKLLLEGTPKPLRVCGVRAAGFAEHARENTWRIAPDGRVLGLHDDIHNHAMRAFAYYALTKYPPPRSSYIVGADDEEQPLPDPLERRRRLAVELDTDVEPLAADAVL